MARLLLRTLTKLFWSQNCHNHISQTRRQPEANGSPNLDPAKNVREVQLDRRRPQAVEARKLLRRMVTATGTLNESITAVQRAKVWLDVKSLNSR